MFSGITTVFKRAVIVAILLAFLIGGVAAHQIVMTVFHDIVELITGHSSLPTPSLHLKH
jgi:hypothetical protein